MSLTEAGKGRESSWLSFLCSGIRIPLPGSHRISLLLSRYHFFRPPGWPSSSVHFSPWHCLEC